MLFSERSIWTMIHGIVLGGGALMMLSASLFVLMAMWPAQGGEKAATHQARALSRLMTGTAIVLWLAVLTGTYLIFPPYRATPPEGVADLSEYPRALVLANPDTAWLHAFAMESKEHVPWIAAMLATAAAFVAGRYRARVLVDPWLRHLTGVLVAVSLVLVAFVSLMGIFVNKVAPLD